MFRSQVSSGTSGSVTPSAHLRGGIVATVILAFAMHTSIAAAASSWSPTLLVNTEAFQVIDDQDNNSNVILRFGQTLDKTITFDRDSDVFRFNDDVWISGTASGTFIHAQDGLSSSGTLVFEGAASGASLYLGTSLNGAGLSDCDNATTSKLLWDSTTGRFSCGTDQTGGGSFGSGNVLTVGDKRYVNVSGDTMTGTLVIRSQSGVTANGLNVVGGISGAYIKASQALSASGNLFVERGGFFGSGVVISRAEDSAFLTLNDTTNNDNITIRTGSGSPNGSLSAQLGSLFVDHASGRVYKNNNGAKQWVEIISGSGTLHMAEMTRAAAQTITTTTNTEVDFDDVTYDVGGIADTTNNRFNITKAGKYYVSVYWSTSAFLDTGEEMVVWIYKNGATNVQDRQNSSKTNGYITAQATTILDLVPGDYLSMHIYQDEGASYNTDTSYYLRPKMQVIQLQSAATGGSSSLFTDDGAITYLTSSSDDLAIGGNTSVAPFYVDVSTSTTYVTILSGALLHAVNTVSSSGTLVFEGAASGASLYLGTSLNGAGLSDCDNATTSKLLWDSTTGRFSCGTDQSGGSFGSGNVLTIGDSRYVNVAGDTMTGALTINLSSGFLGLNIKQWASGAFLHAEKGLSSSGNLIVDGPVIFGSTLSLAGVTYTFPNYDGAGSGYLLMTDGAGQLSWGKLGSGALKTRTMQIAVPLNTAAITSDGTDNALNVYIGSQTGATVNPHQYYRVATSSGQLQDITIRYKVHLPQNFVDFTSLSNDLQFSYRTTSASALVNKLDILVEDDEGDDAYTASEGQGLTSTSWTTFANEFDGGSFDPVAGEYITITITGYATSAGDAFVGEVLLTYTGR